MRRVYKTSGTAEFHCEGHPIHEHGRDVDGAGHHCIVFVWVPGCLQIDDHDPHPLRGCDRGCESYLLTAGDDPRQAQTEEFTEPASSEA